MYLVLILALLISTSPKSNATQVDGDFCHLEVNLRLREGPKPFFPLFVFYIFFVKIEKSGFLLAFCFHSVYFLFPFSLFSVITLFTSCYHSIYFTFLFCLLSVPILFTFCSCSVYLLIIFLQSSEHSQAREKKGFDPTKTIYLKLRSKIIYY